MALDWGDIALGLGTGIMQGANEEQKAKQERIDKRIEKLMDNRYELAKSKHKSEYESYLKRKTEKESIRSAGQLGVVKYLTDIGVKDPEKFMRNNPDYQIPEEYFYAGDEPIFDYATDVDFEVTVPNRLASKIAGVFGKETPSTEEQISAQMSKLTAPTTRKAADVMVGRPMLPEQAIEWGADTEKAPEIKEVFDESGRKVKIQYTGKSGDAFEGVSGWKQIGGAEAVSAEKGAPKSFVYFDAKGQETRAIYTGNPEDTAGGVSGFKQMGGVKSTTEGGAPVVKKIYDETSGGEVNAIYTGNASDNFGGQQGWARFGGIKVDEGSVARERWDVIKPIIMAPATNKKVTIGQFYSADIYINANREALSAEYADALQTFENIGINTIDFAASGIMLPIGGEQVPATEENIARYAQAAGKTAKEAKIALYRSYTGKD